MGDRLPDDQPGEHRSLFDSFDFRAVFQKYANRLRYAGYFDPEESKNEKNQTSSGSTNAEGSLRRDNDPMWRPMVIFIPGLLGIGEPKTC